MGGNRVVAEIADTEFDRLTRQLFGTLPDAGVHIELISTSEVRITCMIAEADLETALRALHDAFELERPEPIDVGAAAAG